MIKAAEFVEAQEVIDRVLDATVDPSYEPALRLKQRLQDPEWNNQARTPAHLANVKEVERLLKLGEGAMALGDFDKVGSSWLHSKIVCNEGCRALIKLNTVQ